VVFKLEEGKGPGTKTPGCKNRSLLERGFVPVETTPASGIFLDSRREPRK